MCAMMMESSLFEDDLYSSYSFGQLKYQECTTSTMDTMDAFPTLPPEVWSSIFAECSRSDLKSLTRTCRNFRWLAQPAIFQHITMILDYASYDHALDLFLVEHSQQMQDLLTQKIAFCSSQRIAASVRKCKIVLENPLLHNIHFSVVMQDVGAAQYETGEERQLAIQQTTCDMAFASLHAFANITMLHLRHLALNDLHLMGIASLPHLTSLKIVNCTSKSTQSVPICALSIRFQGSFNGDPRLIKNFIDPKHIRRLSMSSVSRSFIDAVPVMPHLSSVRLRGIHGPTGGLFARFPAVEDLFSTEHTPTPGQCLKLKVFSSWDPGYLFGVVGNCQTIQHARISNLIFRNAFHNLLRQQGPQLESLRIDMLSLTASESYLTLTTFLVILAKTCPNLRALDFTMSHKVWIGDADHSNDGILTSTYQETLRRISILKGLEVGLGTEITLPPKIEFLSIDIVSCAGIDRVEAAEFRLGPIQHSTKLILGEKYPHLKMISFCGIAYPCDPRTGEDAPNADPPGTHLGINNWLMDYLGRDPLSYTNSDGFDSD